jgi:hypothetical protein
MKSIFAPLRDGEEVKTYNGYGADVELHDDRLVVRREGRLAKAAGFGPTREIPLTAIANVALKSASRLVNGHIQLVLGSDSPRDHRNDPNSVLFTRKHQTEFEELTELLRAEIAKNQAAGVDPSTIEVDHGVSRVDRLKAKREAKATELKAERESLPSKDAQLEQRRAGLTQYLDWAKTFEGESASEAGSDCPVALKAGEQVYMTGQGSALIEPRRGAGHWVGGSTGLSVRVPGTRSMRYRVGATRGHFVQGEERPTPIDTGVVVITNQRAVFMGSKQTREWLWAKLIGVIHSSDAPWTAISVSNREKTSGFLYDDEHSDDIRFRLDLAISRALGTTDELVAQIEGELAALPAPEPTQAPAAPGTTTLPPPASKAAAWQTDPRHRHQLRYWDGGRWTEYAADNGQQVTDPIDT